MDSSDRPVLRSRVWLLAALLLVALFLVLSTIGVDQPVSVWVVVAFAVGAAVTVLSWALVRTRRQRRSYEAELTAWAAERAANAERLRIARDLHDLASHGLGLITVRAAAARMRSGPAGDAERSQALADIERTGRQATTELRRLLTVLRSPGDEVPRRPADTLAALPDIIEVARTRGLAATLRLHEPGEVSPAVQLTVCAIVREGLANTVRHAGPGSTARITICRAGDAIVTTIEDEGPTPSWQPHPGAGKGLAGLSERVGLLGGTLHTGHAGRGYRITARIPDPEARGPEPRS